MDKATEFLDVLAFKSGWNIKIKYKTESLLMKLISYVLFFNKAFMTQYITTIGDTIYFPSEEMYMSDPNTTISIIAHEYVHLNDDANDKLYKFKYLFPQILAPLMLLFGFISWYIAVPLFVLFLLPIPAYWRKQYELSAYKMSLFTAQELNKKEGWSTAQSAEYLNDLADFYNKQFTSMAYYFMWPFGVKKELSETVDKVISDDILDDSALYIQVQSAFDSIS